MKRGHKWHNISSNDAQNNKLAESVYVSGGRALHLVLSMAVLTLWTSISFGATATTTTTITQV